MSDKGQNKETRTLTHQNQGADFSNFVLEKSIFSNVFEKDIKRVYIYKKAERLAKAVQLVAPAFRQTPALGERMSRIAVALVDAAVLSPSEAKDALARELLSLSSILSIARTAGQLSPMNADLIGREAHILLEEIAAYEEPRLSMPESATLAELAREAVAHRAAAVTRSAPMARTAEQEPSSQMGSPEARRIQGHGASVVKDRPQSSEKTDSRREAIIAVLRTKGPSHIKDISTVVRDVSEKTIQRELQALVVEGVVSRTGERRWTTYELAGQE